MPFLSNIAFTIIVPKDNDKDSNLKNDDDDGDKSCLLYMCWEAPWVPANSPAAPDLKKFVSCNSGLTYLLTELKEEKEPILEIVLRKKSVLSRQKQKNPNPIWPS